MRGAERQARCGVLAVNRSFPIGNSLKGFKRGN